jgi:hypothetical protein
MVGTHHADTNDSNPHAQVRSPLILLGPTTPQAASDSKRMVNEVVATINAMSALTAARTSE